MPRVHINRNTSSSRGQLTFEGAWPTAVAFTSDDKLVAGNEDGQFSCGISRTRPSNLRTTKKRTRRSRTGSRTSARAAAQRAHQRRDAIAGGRRTARRSISASLDHTIALWDTTASASGKVEIVLDGDLRRRRTRYREKEKDAIQRPGMKVETQGPTAGTPGTWRLGSALGLSAATATRLVTGDDSNVTIAWDFARGRKSRAGSGHKMCGVVSAAVSPDGKKCFVAEHRMPPRRLRPPARAGQPFRSRRPAQSSSTCWWYSSPT